MSRTTREDWLTAGLALLERGGDAMLTIDRLCKRLRRTKGSFYHHFADMEAFEDAVLARWETLNAVEGARVAAAAGGPPASRLEVLVPGDDCRLELAIRAWALRDRSARAVLARVDRRRLDYLAALHAAAGATSAAALRLARLEYAAFIGAQLLYGGLGAPAARDLAATLARALELAADAL